MPAAASAAVDGLPFVDEHAVEVAAPPDDVWGVLPGLGRPMPGFRVVSAVPPSRLLLAGSHLFSSYRLTFRVEPVGDRRSRLVAESRAAFPGMHGALYRAAVIGTGAHVVAVRRLLAGIKQRAERRSG